MRNYLPQQESPVKKETIHFIENVKKILNSGSSIKTELDKFIPQIFNFRLLALKWLVNQPDIDVLHFMDQAFPAIESLQNNPKLQLLAENILFAMRCNNRVIKNIMRDGVVPTSGQLSRDLSAAPYTTYEQFFGALALSIPDDRGFQSIADFIHASLYIEFITVAAIIMDEERVEVADKTINDLAFIIADAAQNYFAIASQLGILNTGAKSVSANNLIASSYLEEDQLLSNLDLSNFAANF